MVLVSAHHTLRRDKSGRLLCEQVDLEDIGKLYQTPTYVYSYRQLVENCRKFKEAFSFHKTTICFAVKANSNLSLLKTIFSQGIGADIVSEGELERVLRAGCRPEKIVFSGVGKKTNEMEKAISCGVMLFNIESPFELEMLGSIAKFSKKKIPISLRVNPNIDAKTHAKISTGLYETKFGLPEESIPELLNRIRQDPYLELVGLSCHIGSQMTQLGPLRETARRMRQICEGVRQQGFGLKFIDLGGGLGIPYQNELVPTVNEYAECLLSETKPLGLELIIEPGRSLIGDVGFLLTKVIGVKKNSKKCFVILDAAMNDLIRPALYDSYHPIIPSIERGTLTDGNKEICQFVGPICETGDILGLERELGMPVQGDYFAIAYAGAYGASMSSQYNSRVRAAEVLVEGKKIHLIRRRETLEDLWALEEPSVTIGIVHD